MTWDRKGEGLFFSSEVELSLAWLVEEHGAGLGLSGTARVVQQVVAAQSVAGEGLRPLGKAPGPLLNLMEEAGVGGEGGGVAGRVEAAGTPRDDRYLRPTG